MSLPKDSKKKKIKTIILSKVGGGLFESRSVILRSWKLLMQSKFIVQYDETGTFKDYERVNCNIFHQRLKGYKESIIIKVEVPSKTQVFSYSELLQIYLEVATTWNL